MKKVPKISGTFWKNHLNFSKTMGNISYFWTEKVCNRKCMRFSDKYHILGKNPKVSDWATIQRSWIMNILWSSICFYYIFCFTWISSVAQPLFFFSPYINDYVLPSLYNVLVYTMYYLPNEPAPLGITSGITLAMTFFFLIFII